MSASEKTYVTAYSRFSDKKPDFLWMYRRHWATIGKILFSELAKEGYVFEKMTMSILYLRLEDKTSTCWKHKTKINF